MAKDRNTYLEALGVGVGEAQQDKPWDEWLVSKLPAAAGGLFAHTVYNWAVEGVFSSLVPKYGRDVVGSLFLTVVAYLLDHNRPLLLFKRKGFSDDSTKAFTDGMMGRGAPAVTNAVLEIIQKLGDFLSGKTTPPKKANAIMPSNEANKPNLDEAPAAFADMMSLLANSPKTREMLTSDLLTKMEQAGIEVSIQAKSNIANCIGDLANTYKS